MSVGLTPQIERKYQDIFCMPHSWSTIKNSHKWTKKMKHRLERRIAKKDPECFPKYNKYDGWEW